MKGGARGQRIQRAFTDSDGCGSAVRRSITNEQEDRGGRLRLMVATKEPVGWLECDSVYLIGRLDNQGQLGWSLWNVAVEERRMMEV